MPRDEFDPSRIWPDDAPISGKVLTADAEAAALALRRLAIVLRERKFHELADICVDGANAIQDLLACV